MSFTHQKAPLSTEPHKYFEYGDNLPHGADYWMRSDGIFVFRLELDQALHEQITDKSEAASKAALKGTNPTDDVKARALKKFKSKEIVKIAKLISDQIKGIHDVRSIAHGMLLPQDRKTNYLSAISISPRKISSECLNRLADPKRQPNSSLRNAEIRDHLSSKIKLVSLRGKGLGDTLDIEAPVALLLRQQFNNCFEACFNVVERTKHSSLRVPFIDAPRINAWLARFHWINVRSFWCIFALYLISIIAIMAITFAVHVDGEAKMSAFWATSWANAKPVLVICTFMFSILFGFVEISVKRNEAIKAFEKAQEILRAGNTYCIVIKNLFTTIDKNPSKAVKIADQDPRVLAGKIDRNVMMRIETEGDFSNAIEVLQVWKTREQNKRWLVAALLTPIIFYTGQPLIEFVQEGYPAIFGLFKMIMNWTGFGDMLPEAA